MGKVTIINIETRKEERERKRNIYLLHNVLCTVSDLQFVCSVGTLLFNFSYAWKSMSIL